MWLSFYVTVLVTLLYLGVPGYLLGRTVGIPRMTALLASAPLGVAVLCLMGQAYSMAGVPATPVMMVGLPTTVLLVAALLRRRTPRGTADGAPAVHPALVALFLVAGLAASYVFLASMLPSPNVFHQDYDTVHHINSIRAMMDSLSMSPLDGRSYSTESNALLSVQSTGYYPSGWHVLCATVALSTNVSVTSAVNAVNLAFMAVVYPLSMLLLLSTLFPGRTRVVALGAVGSLTLTIFPWGISNWGPVYPNIASFAVLPAICALFMRTFDQGDNRRATLAHLVAWALAAGGTVLLHPNVVFSMAVFLVPWIVARVWGSSLRVRCGSRVSVGPRALAVGFALLCVVIWVGATKIPAFKGLIGYHWDAFARDDNAITNVLHLSYMRGMWPAPDAEQLFPAALLLVGGVLLASRRETRWAVVPYAIAAYMTYVACGSSDDAFRSILIGYWYSDPYRIGSLATIFSVPLIAFGLDAVTEGACRLVRLTPAQNWRGLSVAAALVVAAVYVPLALFYPGKAQNGFNYDNNSPWATYQNYVWRAYSHEAPLTYQEANFMEEAHRLVGNDLVINQPFDGSVFGYGVTGMRCYYRFFSGYGGSDETWQSRVIRQRLYNIANDSQVQEAVESIGARYVLVMSTDERNNTFVKDTYDATKWRGINYITDDTPGFELVLEENGYKLYRITG
ncbi:DUF6541 family protein [Olsenella sp. Marseille-P4559]|uniref:DUF6541 family protein n=1 Tax=Olsenella sp. Marseille-P4559 TaxID=2364795 RepID=UPI00102FC853|nr:DUF6541 family protein [Olsenella sp. Marseille-P4559]